MAPRAPRPDRPRFDQPRDAGAGEGPRDDGRGERHEAVVGGGPEEA